MLRILLLLCCITTVTALTFAEDTKVMQGNIKYEFPANLTVDRYETSSEGLTLNNDDLLLITPEGGIISVKIYEYSKEEVLIGINSSVTQTITFTAVKNDQEQYLKSEDTLYADSLTLSRGETLFTYEERGRNNSRDEEGTSWFNQNVFSFETSTETNSEGVITGKTTDITVGQIIITLVILTGVIILWRLLKK